MKQAIMFQRAEGTILLLFSLIAYWVKVHDLQQVGLFWLGYTILFFAFDLSMIGYLKNNKLGALVYNLGHSLVLPLLLLIFSFNPYLSLFCLIWIGHIGFDRALGYGLKSTEGFTYTHLGIIGNKKPRD